mmetsp:Transcript_74548/g.210631  ORF Transcript_74548/g.210631 Transcript_74548/m.210631 type:complete len:217 (-) Transcript_74548:341-991(-)
MTMPRQNSELREFAGKRTDIDMTWAWNALALGTPSMPTTSSWASSAPCRFSSWNDAAAALTHDCSARPEPSGLYSKPTFSCRKRTSMFLDSGMITSPSSFGCSKSSPPSLSIIYNMQTFRLCRNDRCFSTSPPSMSSPASGSGLRLAASARLLCRSRASPSVRPDAAKPRDCSVRGARTMPSCVIWRSQTLRTLVRGLSGVSKPRWNAFVQLLRPR